VQDSQLVLFGYLYDVQQTDPGTAQVIGKLYFGSLDEAGARKVAHDFAADILKLFGAQTLQGSKIYFASTRTGKGIKELWSMDFDGANQKQLTFYKSVSTMPAISPDGKRLAFTSFHLGNPAILIHSLETTRRLPFYNQAASMNATAEFTPDGKSMLFSNTLSGYAQIYVANIDGSGVRRISSSRAIEVEPKVNPKNPTELVFVSGRSGYPQIYKMNMDGADVTRLSSGEGEAVNPSWHPDGRHIAFAWTKGYDPGNYNIFVMDVATQEYVQLTHGTGRNENPFWGPDGKHLVFASNRGGTIQLYTMLADGTQLKQLTTQGTNEKPVWSRQ
jgi:TolB protein